MFYHIFWGSFDSPALFPLIFLPSQRWYVISKQHRILTTDMVTHRHFSNSFQPTLLLQLRRTGGFFAGRIWRWDPFICECRWSFREASSLPWDLMSEYKTHCTALYRKSGDTGSNRSWIRRIWSYSDWLGAGLCRSNTLQKSRGMAGRGMWYKVLITVQS